MSNPTPEEIKRLQGMPEFKGREAHRPGPLRDAALAAIRGTAPRCPNCGNGYLYGESLDHDCWRTLAQHLGMSSTPPAEGETPEALKAALDLAAWSQNDQGRFELGAIMLRYIGDGENIDTGAMRILADEVKRLERASQDLAKIAGDLRANLTGELLEAEKELNSCRSFLRMNAQYESEYAGRIRSREATIKRIEGYLKTAAAGEVGGE